MRKVHPFSIATFLRAALALGLVVCFFRSAVADERPNIVLIMVDDMGFSDLGCYGGEIETPNIDKLAARGVRFSRFYNSSRCCPTRASLLTGLHPHLTGIGHMTNPPPPKQARHDAGREFPNYRGFLNRRCVTIAEILKPAGYATFIAGKWHLGMAKKDQWPLQRGFERFYGCLSGATRFFSPVEPRHMTRDNEYKVEPKSTTERPFYTTDAFTDHAIGFIDEERKGKNRPFFLYLSYTAPHWPHQAHEEDIAKYKGKYMEGWEAIRKRRYERQIELGLIDPKWMLSPRPSDVPEWSTIKPRKRNELDMRMAVYAAMIDRVDQNIGKLVRALEKGGKAENTLILFLSDNGACAEGPPLGRGQILDTEKRNRQGANNYGAAWAHVSSTPFRLYKHFTHEGGAATPFFMCWPARIRSQKEWYDSPAQLIDVLPTLLGVAQAKYPKSSRGDSIPPSRGVSLAPAFDGKPLRREAPMYSEHENNAFIMHGDWKLVGRGVSTPDGPKAEKWELYNLAEDRTELKDQSSSEPNLVKRMAAQWLQWAKTDKIYPKPKRRGGRKK
ncbi:MAG: arylsulfatase [Planctomycetota bacterium]